MEAKEAKESVSPGKSLLRAGAMVKVAPFGQGTTVKAEREEDGMVEVKLKYGTAYLRRALVLPGLLDMNPAVRRTYETCGALVVVVRACRLCGERTRCGLAWAASSRDGVVQQECVVDGCVMGCLVGMCGTARTVWGSTGGLLRVPCAAPNAGDWNGRRETRHHT